jgi:RHH-type proline utilization regulon transcriptional repressor/proline dehydrogenase/delta 1-pyrroline-5-carboxylate dehydrogenase
VTGGADLDLAIKDRARSVRPRRPEVLRGKSRDFEAGIYDDERFLQRIADAVRSIRVGPPQELATMMGPLVLPPGDKLRRVHDPRRRRAMARRTRALDESGRLWSPGVRIGVQPDRGSIAPNASGRCSASCARDLDDVCAAIAPEFGLTGGLHSLDPDEMLHWLEPRAGRERVCESPHHGCDRAAPTVRWLEAFVDRSRRQDRRTR